MSKNEQRFQKAFLLQMRATFRGNPNQAGRARQMVNYYRKKLEEKN
ncbi:MAG: hypothetical protein ACD_37C00580G0005 [uncultured bacterium]|nr:MAG: hypothetical protein ACD_37C00580G0005 [uncultured bacterium]